MLKLKEMMYGKCLGQYCSRLSDNKSVDTQGEAWDEAGSSALGLHYPKSSNWWGITTTRPAGQPHRALPVYVPGHVLSLLSHLTDASQQSCELGTVVYPHLTGKETEA